MWEFPEELRVESFGRSIRPPQVLAPLRIARSSLLEKRQTTVQTLNRIFVAYLMVKGGRSPGLRGIVASVMRIANGRIVFVRGFLLGALIARRWVPSTNVGGYLSRVRCQRAGENRSRRMAKPL